jgi:hypothetical protein
VRRLPGGETSWQRLQAAAYGPRLCEASLFPGVVDFLAQARRFGATVRIISHKTRFASQGADDLHAAARRFLRQQGLLRPSLDETSEDPGAPNPTDTFFIPETVFFETSRRAKLERIAALDLDVFVDDLPEVLCDPLFPPGTRRVLFAPYGPDDGAVPEMVAEVGGVAVASYAALSRLVFGTVKEGG